MHFVQLDLLLGFSAQLFHLASCDAHLCHMGQ
jgi:hypothetical protein